ncbi:MAG: MaoC/PaaZ C-terminal domain-containing protein [Arachnia sp.]
MTEALSVGSVLPELRVRITRAGIVRYSGASTDFNDIHFSDRHARAIGLPGVVAHGMWTMGAGLRVVTDWNKDPGKVVEYFVRFTRPVVVPDTDEGVEVVYNAVVKAVSKGVATLSITATCGDDAVLGAARAQVRLD